MPHTLEQAEALLEQRLLPASIAAFEQLRQAGSQPERCSAGLWQAHMLAADFDSAWRESDWLRERGTTDPHRFWNGEPIDRQRLIVRSLHGLGDAVQMLSYAPLLRARASRIIFEVAPALLPIAHLFDGVEDVITWGPLAPSHPPVWDVQLEITELPYLFRTTLADLPIATRYLKLPLSSLALAAEKMHPPVKPRIGIVLSSADWNATRDCPASHLAPLLTDPRYEFWNLHPQPLPGLHHQVDITGKGLLPLAATITQLDAVITVDTLAAHLAGALGIRTLLLLQYAADWRWLHDRDASPWYPSLKLFRQPTPGDWPGAVRALSQHLDTLSL
jgi:hypothetical protein